MIAAEWTRPVCQAFIAPSQARSACSTAATADVDTERDRQRAEGHADAVTGETDQSRSGDISIRSALGACLGRNVVRDAPSTNCADRRPCCAL